MNTQKLEIKYRNWFKGIPLRPIKLEIPGWAGDSHGHSDGDKPQPWHCPPFVAGSTYGLELLYPFDTECHVKNVDNELIFDGDFSAEQEGCPIKLPPFMSFAPQGHFGFTSSIDIKPPPGYIVRLEPHPRYYTDATQTVPCAVAGNIQGEWWPKIFFVAFKPPFPGQKYIFRKNEAFAQILILPRKFVYDIKEMTEEEKNHRSRSEKIINEHGKYLSKNRWTDCTGNTFDDRYKVLQNIFDKYGIEGIDSAVEELVKRKENFTDEMRSKGRSKMHRKFIKVKK